MTQLREFEFVIEINKYGSVSKAAKALKIAQPTLSKYLARLEDDLGVMLFDRRKFPLKPTEAGEKYITAGKRILETYKRLEKDFSLMKSGEDKVLKIGISPTRAHFVLPKLVSEFHSKNNDTRLVVKEKNTAQLNKETFRSNWQGVLLPVIILLPFMVDFFLNNVTAFPDSAIFVERLGKAGAKSYSSSLLFFVAGIAAFFAVVVMLFKDKEVVSPKNIVKMLGGSAKGIANTVGTCLFGYMIGALFNDINVTADLSTYLEGLNMGKVGLSFIIPLITCFAGMIIPGSSLVSIFGALFIGLFYAEGANPVLVAAMLPCFCGVMCGITPPLALGMYAGMSIAESDPSKTIKNDLWWVAVQYLLEVIVLLGWLPVIGL